MLDAHYVNPRLVELYDLDSGWSVDRSFYLELAGSSPKRVLDLGCGTGLICDAYAARGHQVTGLDPSESMLEVARRKPHAASIEWVCSTAQDYRSGKRFDLIIMTGHAFQVLLEDDEIAAALTVMRQHLKPDGRAVFESRNPAIDWAKEWAGERTLEHNGETVRLTNPVTASIGDRVFFESRFHFPDEYLVSKSELRFLPQQGIEERLAAAGLIVESLFGDWDGTQFDPQISKEMIFVARAANGGSD